MNKQCCICNLFLVLGKRIFSDKLTYSAAALTFTTLLALVPLLTVVISLLSFLPGFHQIDVQLQSFILHNFLPDSGAIIQQYLHEFIAKARASSIVGGLFLFVTVIITIFTVERVFSDIWKVDRKQYSIFSWLRHWAMLWLLPVFVAIWIAVVFYLISLPGFHKVLSLYPFDLFSIRYLPFVMMVFGLSFLYFLLPHCKVYFRHAFVSGLLVAILFYITKKLFALYVVVFANYQIIYGAMAALPLFLIWIYLLWIIVLFGALLTNVLGEGRVQKMTKPRDDK